MTFHRQFTNHFARYKGVYDLSVCLILMRSYDVAGQGRLTPFSSGQLFIK